MGEIDPIHDKLDQIDAKILATQTAFRVLLMAHPDRQMVANAVQAEIERVYSTALPRPVSDAYVEAYLGAAKILIPRDLRHGA